MPRLKNEKERKRNQMVDLSKNVKQSLSEQGIDVAVSVGGVDVPRGHLAVVFTLSCPSASLDQRRETARIVEEECIKYLQARGKAKKNQRIA